jgi:hypothetical protein
MHSPHQFSWDTMNRLEQLLFPRSKLLNFLIIALLSTAISFLLVGRQIFLANWGVIDDHEVFRYLGPGLHLPASDIWSTLLAKTEVGTLQGRFRPSYYLIKLIETSIWGANVHLWYLGHTIGFAIFLSSIWWILLRFVGGWLSGVLTGAIAVLPLWTDVWSRLGPSEIYGAACVGIMLFAADFILFSENARTRSLSAITLALATIVLVGLKETFIPLATGTAIIFIFAAIRKKLSPILVSVLALAMAACLGGLVYVISRQVGVGADFYGNSVGFWLTIRFGIVGVFDALLRTWWLFVLPILFFQTLQLLPRKPLGRWIMESREAVGIYCFLVAMYAAQCALYRSSFPHNSRYDFPAMLLVPLACCVLVCEISRQARRHFAESTIDHAQLTAAGFLFFALVVGSLGKAPPLVAAVQTNIKETNLFYGELQRLVVAAQQSPGTPIILEAFGPKAYEPVLSLPYFTRAFGVRNPISVRYHPDENSKGVLYDGLQRTLADLQKGGDGPFTPLQENLAHRAQGCLSVGIDGPPDSTCSGFQVRS